MIVFLFQCYPRRLQETSERLLPLMVKASVEAEPFTIGEHWLTGWLVVVLSHMLPMPPTAGCIHPRPLFSRRASPKDVYIQ